MAYCEVACSYPLHIISYIKFAYLLCFFSFFSLFFYILCSKWKSNQITCIILNSFCFGLDNKNHWYGEGKSGKQKTYPLVDFGDKDNLMCECRGKESFLRYYKRCVGWLEILGFKRSMESSTAHSLRFGCSGYCRLNLECQ